MVSLTQTHAVRKQNRVYFWTFNLLLQQEKSTYLVIVTMVFVTIGVKVGGTYFRMDITFFTF